VGRDGGAVGDEGQVLGTNALAGDEGTDTLEDAERGIVRHRRGLEDRQRAALVVPQREVGECSAHVDADRPHRGTVAPGSRPVNARGYRCTLPPSYEGLRFRPAAVAVPRPPLLLPRPQRAVRPSPGYAGLRRAPGADGP